MQSGTPVTMTTPADMTLRGQTTRLVHRRAGSIP
jgi:hypothetical protein